MKDRKGNALKTVFKICVSGVLLFFLLRKVGWDELKESFAKINPLVFVFAVTCHIVSVVEGAFKWKTFLSKVSIKKLLATCFGAQFFSTVLPGQLFGEMSKIAMLHSETTTNSEIAASVVADKLTGLFTSVAVGIMGILFTEIDLSGSIRWMFLILFSFFGFCFYLPYIPPADKFLVRWISLGENVGNAVVRKIAGGCKRVYEAWRGYVGDGRRVAQNILWGFAVQFTGVIQMWGILWALNINISLIEFMWIIPAVSVLLLLPVSFGGLGVREVSVTGFLGLFAVPGNSAVSVSLIILLGQIVSALIGGGCLLLDRPKGRFSQEDMS